jgi:hypothetical protein
VVDVFPVNRREEDIIIKEVLHQSYSAERMSAAVSVGASAAAPMTTRPGVRSILRGLLFPALDP